MVVKKMARNGLKIGTLFQFLFEYVFRFPFFSHVRLFILLCKSTVKSINTSCLKSSFAIYRLLMKDTSNGLFTPLRKKTISHLVTLVNSQLSNMILLIFPCIFAWFYPKMSACCSLRNLGYF